LVVSAAFCAKWLTNWNVSSLNARSSSLQRPLEVEVRRHALLVVEPPALLQLLPDDRVPARHAEHLLGRSDPVALLPGRKVPRFRDDLRVAGLELAESSDHGLHVHGRACVGGLFRCSSRGRAFLLLPGLGEGLLPRCGLLQPLLGLLLDPLPPLLLQHAGVLVLLLLLPALVGQLLEIPVLLALERLALLLRSLLELLRWLVDKRLTR